MSELEQEIRQVPEDDPVPVRGPAHRRGLERSFGLIAGILFIGGALAGIPSSLLIEPAPPASLYLVTVSGFAFGLAAMSIPWDRISPLWTHVAMILAIVQVGVTVALAGDPFVFYFVFIAIFAAYAFSDRNQVATYLGLIGVALLLPIVVIPDETRATAAQALAAMPAIALVAIMVAFLRERLEANRATTRRFAREALALSERIGRHQVSPLPVPQGRTAPGFAHPVWRRVAIGSSAALAVIVATGTLTAAGVAMPKPIEDTFASVGIEPPKGADRPAGKGTGGPPDAERAPDAEQVVQGSPGGKPGGGRVVNPRSGSEGGHRPRESTIASGETSSPNAPTGAADPVRTPSPNGGAVTQDEPATSPPSQELAPGSPTTPAPGETSAPTPKSPVQNLGDQIGSLVEGLLGGRREP